MNYKTLALATVTASLVACMPTTDTGTTAGSSSSSVMMSTSSMSSSASSSLTSSSVTGTAYVAPGCKLMGCSSQICGNENDEAMVTTCEYREAYECFKSARCEKQTNGSCGWTMDDELRMCLADKGMPELAE